MDPVLAWPVAVDAAGRLVTVPARSAAHAAQAAAILALTRPGDRVAVGKEQMGTPDPVGRRSYDTAALQAAVDRWAPFVEVVDVTFDPDSDDPLAVNVTARVRSRT